MGKRFEQEITKEIVGMANKNIITLHTSRMANNGDGFKRIHKCQNLSNCTL